MGVKEKLIELLTTMIFVRHGVDPAEAIADYLIDNGVTILKWNRVEDGLPKHSEKYESYLVEVCESHWPTCSCDPCDAPYSTEYVDVARYDSDQKLWYIGSPEITLNALLVPDDAPLNGMCVLAWAEMPTRQKDG